MINKILDIYRVNKERLLFFPIVLSLIFFIYIQFLSTDRYTSVSILGVKSEGKNLTESINLPINLPAQSSEIKELRAYLNSDESVLFIKSFVELGSYNDFLKPNFFDLHSKDFFEYDVRDQIDSFSKIILDTESGVIRIETTAFSAEHSLIFNIAQILSAIHFFDQRQEFAASTTYTNRLCSFVGISQEINQPDESSQVILELSNNRSTDTREILKNINKDKSTQCLEFLKESQNLGQSINSNITQSFNLPRTVVQNVDSMIKEELIIDLLQSLQEEKMKSDKLVILSQPLIPYDKDKKMALIYTLAFFLFVSSIAVSIRVIRQIIKDYS